MEPVSLNRERRKPVVRAASESTENDKTGKARYGVQNGLSFEDIRVRYVARRARPFQDFDVSDEDDEVGPEHPPRCKGASTFSSVDGVSLTGHYHRLPGGTQLSDRLGVVADGRNARAVHHTIYPAVRTQVRQFNDLFIELPWEHAGNKQPQGQRQREGARNPGGAGQ